MTFYKIAFGFSVFLVLALSFGAFVFMSAWGSEARVGRMSAEILMGPVGILLIGGALLALSFFLNTRSFRALSYIPLLVPSLAGAFFGFQAFKVLFVESWNREKMAAIEYRLHVPASYEGPIIIDFQLAPGGEPVSADIEISDRGRGTLAYPLKTSHQVLMHQYDVFVGGEKKLTLSKRTSSGQDNGVRVGFCVEKVRDAWIECELPFDWDSKGGASDQPAK